MFKIVYIFIHFSSYTKATSLLDTRSHDLSQNVNCTEGCLVTRTKTSCSCDVMCTIDRNCCENLQQMCPAIYNESVDRYVQILQSLRGCTNAGYLLVSDCPTGNENDLTSVDVSEAFSFKSRDIIDGQGALSELLGQIPVTDFNSGFTFKNISIYQCRTKLSINQLLFWEMYLEDLSLGYNGELLYDNLSRADYLVLPPEKLERSTINTKCASVFKFQLSISNNEFLTHTNKNGTEVVREIKSRCAVCDGQNEALPEVNKAKSYLPVIASFEFNKVKFKNNPSYHGHRQPAWNVLECSPIDETLKDIAMCSVKRCRSPFVKTSKTQCKTKNVLLLAIPADDVPVGEPHLQQLSGFVQCFLSSYGGYDIRNKWNTSDLIYDNRLRKRFYVTRSLFYWDKEFASFEDIVLTGEHFKNFAKLLQLLRDYTTQTNSESPQRLPDPLTLDKIVTDEEHAIFFNDQYVSKSPNALKGFEIISVCANMLNDPYVDVDVIRFIQLRCIRYVVNRTERVDFGTEGTPCVQIFSRNCGEISTTNRILQILFVAAVRFVFKE